MGDLIELIRQATDRFEIFSMPSELVGAYEDPSTKKKMFKGIASSTTKDLHGDTILLSALRDMESSAVGLTMFLNHSYDVPDDVGGTITKAIVKQKGVDDKGDPAYVLEIEGEVEDDNAEALKTWSYVQKGRRIGLSIGAMIPEGGAKRQKDGSYVIEHLMLLEVSFVGIPANPKSWVEYAASALRGLEKRKQTAQLGSPVIHLDTDAGTYEIRGSLGDLKLAAEPDVPEVEYTFASLPDGKTYFSRSVSDKPDANGMTAVSVEPLGAWDLGDAEQLLAAKATVGEDIVAKATVWVETRDGDKITIGDPPDETASVSADSDPDKTGSAAPDVTDAGCPTCGGSKGSPKGDCSNDYHNAAAPEPDVTDAKIRIIEVDTDDPSSAGDGQGAASSEPDGDTLAAPNLDVTAGAEPVILDGKTEDELLQLSFDQLKSATRVLLNRLTQSERLLAEEKLARVAAETDKQRVIDAAAELVRRTTEVLEKVANAPLTRRAIARETSEVSQSIASYYGEEFARAIAAPGTKH